jgi:hypothetical protein
VARAADGPAPAPASPPRVILDGAALRTWDGALTDLQPLPKWITVRLGAPLATLTLRDGRLLLILGKTEEDSEGHHHKRDGAALLLGWPGGGSADLGFRSQFTVAFEGLPQFATGTEDHAWVYARDAAASAPGQVGKAWVHDIDFHAGRVADSTFLPGVVRGLAVEPDGARLYAALDDRLLSLTTRPLVTSWHYRSPGPNGALAISPDGRILAALRGDVLALFDGPEIAARTPTERRGRVDDATHVLTLDRPPHGVAFSNDGRLVAVFGTDRVTYVDAATGARLGEERVAGAADSGELRPLVFPGGGSDLVVAALPSGAVAALPAPEPPSKRAGTPIAVATVPAAEPAPGTGMADATVPAAPMGAAASDSHAPTAPATPPAAAPTPAAPTAAAPTTAAPTAVAPTIAPGDGGAPPPTAPTASKPEAAGAAPPEARPAEAPASAAPAPPAVPPTLSGHIGGDAGMVSTIVLYGPASIIREYARCPVGSDGAWSMPLPPPGSYRVVPIGDGSTPIPLRPGFLSITVQAGQALAGLDFRAGASN